MKTFTTAVRLAVAGALISSTQAHSWIEQLTNIASNGTMVGEPGYARGNVKRGPGFSDPLMVNLLPYSNDNKIYNSDLMCKKSQTTQTQTDGSPRLQTVAGARIALRYQENGHVTLPQNQPGKPPNRGTVYVYGTTQPKADDSFLSIHRVWTPDGNGGDGRGVLLSTQNFDDGQCYQVNSGSISQARQAEFVHTADSLQGADMWCQQDIQIPQNASSGQPYTLYWVWDWPTMPGTPGQEQGKQEIYTTCMDVDIVSNGGSQAKAAGNNFHFPKQDPANAGISSQLANIANPTAVVGEFIPFSVGSGSSPPASSTGSPSYLSEHSSTATSQASATTSTSDVTVLPITTPPQATTPPQPGVSIVTEISSVFEFVYETVFQKRSEAVETDAPVSAPSSTPTPACSKAHPAYKLKGRSPFIKLPEQDAC